MERICLPKTKLVSFLIYGIPFYFNQLDQIGNTYYNTKAKQSRKELINDHL